MNSLFSLILPKKESGAVGPPVSLNETMEDVEREKIAKKEAKKKKFTGQHLNKMSIYHSLLPVDILNEVYAFFNYRYCQNFLIMNSHFTRNIINHLPCFIRGLEIFRDCLDRARAEQQKQEEYLIGVDSSSIAVVFPKDDPPSFCQRSHLDGSEFAFYDGDWQLIENDKLVEDLEDCVLSVDKKEDGDWPVRTKEIMKYGYPRAIDLYKFQDFVVSWNSKSLNAYWVMEHLTPEKLESINETIGQNKIAVPTDFFKVLLIEKSTGQFHLECYKMPNKEISEPINHFLFDLLDLQRIANLKFFPKLKRNALMTINGIRMQ
uniref:Extracellular Endonuclease subunit A domain-containing protein n=1 Tax=Ditylenchus dipsaci TaxID=166011 RepID=A0A915EFU6_9BILA